LEIVLMLFQQDKISLGKASELLGLHRMVTIQVGKA